MPSLDFVQRFVFDELDARGCLVRLDQTCETIQQTHHYPAGLAEVLNQFAVAAVLLRDSIKLRGSVTIQLRTHGAIKVLMADCMGDRRVRAIAEYESELFAAGRVIDFSQMGDEATLAITITPDEGDRYQSIVPMERASLAECLQDYFARSEQLPTWFSLFANQQSGLGIAVHALPADKVQNRALSQQHFDRLRILLDTLTEQEALALDSEAILTRLFHQESCRLFDPKSVEFGCVCSSQKSLDAIRSLGKPDVIKLISEQRAQGNQGLVVDCHFCFQRYEYPFSEINALFA